MSRCTSQPAKTQTGIGTYALRNRRAPIIQCIGAGFGSGRVDRSRMAPAARLNANQLAQVRELIAQEFNNAFNEVIPDVTANIINQVRALLDERLAAGLSHPQICRRKHLRVETSCTNCHFGKSRGQIVNSGFLGRVIGSGSGCTGRVPGYPGCPVTAGRDQALLGDSRRRCSDQCRVGIWSSTWCATKHPKLPTTIPASFLHQSRRGLFLSARNQEGYNCPKSISRKRTRKCTDFEEGGSRRWSGGCDGVGRFSGVVRPCSWSGCGRGSEGTRMVCLIPAQVAEIDGNGSGGPRWSAVAGPDSGVVQSNRWSGFGRGVIFLRCFRILTCANKITVLALDFTYGLCFKAQQTTLSPYQWVKNEQETVVVAQRRWSEVLWWLPVVAVSIATNFGVSTGKGSRYKGERGPWRFGEDYLPEKREVHRRITSDVAGDPHRLCMFVPSTLNNPLVISLCFPARLLFAQLENSKQNHECEETEVNPVEMVLAGKPLRRCLRGARVHTLTSSDGCLRWYFSYPAFSSTKWRRRRVKWRRKQWLSQGALPPVTHPQASEHQQQIGGLRL
ncbi:hypothetical protein LXL04_002803 [Taraxacum kok-saghyz]